MKTILFFAAALLLTFKAEASAAPYYHIGLINHQDGTTGVADSLNKRYTLTGVVYGGNLAASGKLTFYINDGTGSIEVYSSHTFGYSPTEGDSVMVVGSLTQYGGVADCGQLEIKPSATTAGDTVLKVGTGVLSAPEVISTLDEAHESHLVRVNGLTMSFPTDWTNSSTGFSVRTTQGVKVYFNKYTTAISVTSPGTSAFDIIGIVSQYDTSAPYTQFYSFSPRYASDVITTSSGISEINNNPLRAIVFPNPANNLLTLSFMAEQSENGFMSIADITGKEIVVEPISVSTGENRKEVTLTNLPNGLYLLKIKSGNQISTVKFTVVK